jgi:hypothetical protein
MFCHKCGQKIDEESRFCENCGTAIEKVFPAKSIRPKKGRWGIQPGYGKLVGGILLLVVTVYLVFVVIGLNQAKEKYVGTWMSQPYNVTPYGPPTYKSVTLELRKDGTWDINVPPANIGSDLRIVLFGTRGKKWEVEGNKLRLYYMYNPGSGLPPQAMVWEIKDNKIFVEGGMFFTKQR